MKVLVFGGSGLAGSAIVAALGPKAVAPTRQEFDIGAADPADALFQDIGCVVYAAADKSGDSAAAWRINAEFPRRLGEACGRLAVPLIHISTDGVFDGRRGTYTEDDPPDAADPYGRQKADGEPPQALVLRTSVIGPECRGFSSLLCWFLGQEARCPGFTNHLWNGVSSLELGRIVARLADGGLVSPGVRHVFADDVSKYELLVMLGRAFATDIEVEPSAETTPCDRRLRTRHPGFLADLAIPPLERQIAALPAVCDGRGRWQPSEKG